MKSVNLFTIEAEADPSEPPGYVAPRAKLGPMLGAAMIGGSIYELAPGQSICPFHYEYGNEEWLIVLEGHPALRHYEGDGEAETVLAPGDVVCFPQGREGAHKVTNKTGSPVRVLVLSTMNDPSAAVYPDSDKIGIWPGDERDNLLVRRESVVDYYDGEL
jgi:uncharacterized cupin superfamily protein